MLSPARPSRVDALVTAAAPSLDEAGRAWLAQAVASDAAAWSEEFGALRDRSGLAAERNVFRYLPAETEIRAEAGTPLVEIVRVVAAAIRAGASVRVSVAEALPPIVTTAMRGRGLRRRRARTPRTLTRASPRCRGRACDSWALRQPSSTAPPAAAPTSRCSTAPSRARAASSCSPSCTSRP